MHTIPTRAGFIAARVKGHKALAKGIVIKPLTQESQNGGLALQQQKKLEIQ